MAFLLTLSSLSVSAQCTVTNYYDHLGCYNTYSYWYDNCGNPTYVNQYCTSSQECSEGQCKNLCGNGVCNTNKNENCNNCYSDCKCADYEQCNWGKCETYCGNGRCDGSENCWRCNTDCQCSSSTRCDYPGKCVTYCGNGKCDSDENCQSCYDCTCDKNQECRPNSNKANSMGCVDLCGNGVLDYNENCQTCPEDSPCSVGTYCYNTVCVQCFKDSHCESREVPTGEFICSSDSRSTLEKVTKTQGICQNNICSGEKVDTTKPGTQCGDKLCQDGKCGCSEGYAACLPSGKCEKQSALDDGQSCSCYFQCKSNYCTPEGKCVKAINAPLTVSNSLIKVGETTKVTISADNSLEEDIPTKITLNTNSGVIMSGVIGGSDCSGNQCTGGQVTIQSKGRTSITVDLTAQSYGTHTLTATITPLIGGKQYPKEEKVTVTIINPKDGVCSDGETSQNACSDCGCPSPSSIYEYVCKSDERCKKSIQWHFYIIFLGVIVTIALIIYFTPRAKDYYIKSSEAREKRKTAMEQQEFSDRKKIVTALYKLKKNINLDKPLPIEEVIAKAKLDNINPEMVHEEYIQLLERMKKVEDLSGAEKREAKKEVNVEMQVLKHLAQRFCTGCGSQLREGSKFCTKCGKQTKR
ncbi:hypothetical protein FJZ53_01095 [Candidatus Woesearchaeota archaeon]|nr:hypothetical protein [Candidatus Woesearchaeota archaeon]